MVCGPSPVTPVRLTGTLKVVTYKRTEVSWVFLWWGA